MIGLGIPIMEVYSGNMERKAMYGLAQMKYGLPYAHDRVLGGPWNVSKEMKEESAKVWLSIIIREWSIDHKVSVKWMRPFRRRGKPKLSPECRALCEDFLRNTEHLFD